MKLSVEFNPAIVEELAERLVSHNLHAYREAVANAYDADSPKVEVCFNSDKIIFEDWGAGASDLSAFCAIGSPHKKETIETPIHKRKTIGQKGLGFLSYFKLGSEVKVSINNGLIGYQLIRTLENPLIAEGINGPKDAFLAHQGVKVEITHLKKYTDEVELERYLKQYFSLIVSRGFSISINGKEIRHGKFEEDWECKTKYGRIVGHFRHRGGGVVDVYCRGIWVTKILVDASRNFNARVDCDFITPNAGRDNFVKDNDEWEVFFNILKAKGQNFPKTHSEIAPTFQKSLDKVLRALGAVTKSLGLMLDEEKPLKPPVKNGELKDNGLNAIACNQRDKKTKNTNSHSGEPEEPEIVKVKTVTEGNQKFKILECDYGIQLKWANIENKITPVDYQTPNWLICNQSSEIWKRLDTYNRTQGHSSAVICLIPYIARAYVYLLAETQPKKYDADQETIDKVAQGLYKKMIHAGTPNTPTDATTEGWR